MTNRRSSWEGRSLSDATSGATTDVSLEVRWSTERIGGGNSLVISWGQCGLTISYALPGRGGGVLRWGRRQGRGRKGKLVHIVIKCNGERINNKKKLTPILLMPV